MKLIVCAIYLLIGIGIITLAYADGAAVYRINANKIVVVHSVIKQGNTVRGGHGSGIIISSKGYIVTAAHVVLDAVNVSISFKGNKTKYLAEIVAQDVKKDVAVLKLVKDIDGLTPVVFRTDTPSIGENVYALGHPLGPPHWSLTGGIVTQYEERNTKLISDAIVNFGSSGGGLFDEIGRLVGVVIMKSDQPPLSVSRTSKYVYRWLQGLKRSGIID